VARRVLEQRADGFGEIVGIDPDRQARGGVDPPVEPSAGGTTWSACSAG
jgi:hypothetical protein